MTPDKERKYPFVSVIVPVYNAEAMIGDCIESLLAQDYPDERYEIIIVDNDSTDDTAEVIKSYPVKYVLEDEIHTSYAARNTGARHARGEALAFCDADQVATESWLTNLLSHWHQRDQYAGFCGPCPVIANGVSWIERHYAERRNGYGLAYLNLGRVLEVVPRWAGGNLCVSKRDFRQIGGFKANIPSGEDQAFTYRVAREQGNGWLYIGPAIQWHRARSSLSGILGRHVRVAYGWEEGKAKHGIGISTTLRRSVAVALLFWVRLPWLAPRECVRLDGEEMRYQIFALFADALEASAEALGRLAYHFRLPSRYVGGM